jgi:hypothetical protein
MVANMCGGDNCHCYRLNVGNQCLHIAAIFYPFIGALITTELRVIYATSKRLIKNVSSGMYGARATTA